MWFYQGLTASISLHLAVLLGCYGLGTFTPPELLGGGSGAAFSVSLVSLPGSGAATSSPAVATEAPREVAPPESKPEDAEVQLKKTAKKISLRKEPLRSRELPKEQPPKSLPKASPLTQSANDHTAGGDGAGEGGGGMPGDANGMARLGGFGGSGEGPTIVRSPKPSYPPLARRAEFEGRVVLEVLIDSSGDVSAARVAQSSGREDCDKSALDTVVSRWKFKPALINGVPVPWREKVAVSYKLR